MLTHICLLSRCSLPLSNLLLIVIHRFANDWRRRQINCTHSWMDPNFCSFWMLAHIFLWFHSPLPSFLLLVLLALLSVRGEGISLNHSCMDQNFCSFWMLPYLFLICHYWFLTAFLKVVGVAKISKSFMNRPEFLLISYHIFFFFSTFPNLSDFLLDYIVNFSLPGASRVSKILIKYLCRHAKLWF